MLERAKQGFALTGVRIMRWVILVEGKHDVQRVRSVTPEATVLATNGWPSERRLEVLRQHAQGARVVILTDQDAAGRRIRAELGEIFPDAIHVYIRRSFNGVENAPRDYLVRRLQQAGAIEDSDGAIGPAGDDAALDGTGGMLTKRKGGWDGRKSVSKRHHGAVYGAAQR